MIAQCHAVLEQSIQKVNSRKLMNKSLVTKQTRQQGIYKEEKMNKFGVAKSQYHICYKILSKLSSFKSLITKNFKIKKNVQKFRRETFKIF